MIRLVCGPPGAGKSTFVAANRKPGDKVLDLDEILAGLGADPRQPSPGVLARAQKIRTRVEASLRPSQNVWVIRTLANPVHRASAARRLRAAEVHVLETPAAECIRRIADRPVDLTPVVEKWWADYAPLPGEFRH